MTSNGITLREIKFRGQRAADLKWVFGGYHKHQIFTPAVIIPKGESPKPIEYSYLIIESGFSDWNMPKPLWGHEVIPSTVGQLTGLLDKNGKEIFEGDVLHIEIHNWSRKDDVIASANEFVEFQGGRFGFLWGHRREFKTINCFCETTFEVIGNFHETPELLEATP